MTVILKNITLENLAKFTQVSANFNPDVTYLMGPNGAGKTGLGLTGLWFVMEGVAEKAANKDRNPIIGERFRFIGPDAKSAKGSIVLNDSKHGDIIARRKMTKDGTEVTFESQSGFVPDQKWLSELFDIFMISPKAFTQLDSKKQAEVLGIDLSEFDKSTKEKKESYTLINRQISDIGTLIPVEETEIVSVAIIVEERKNALSFNEVQAERQKDIKDAQDTLDDIISDIDEKNQKIEELKAEIVALEERKTKGNTYIETLPKPEELKDLTALETKLENLSETNLKASEYQRYKENLTKLNTLKGDLDRNKLDQQQIAEKRSEYIQAMELPFENLSIDEEGNLLLGGKPIKDPYFSTGELIKIVPILMSSRNPEFRYVYIQDFNLLDEKMQKETVDYLVGQGLQLVIEYVGENANLENVIRLKDNVIVNEYTKI